MTWLTDLYEWITEIPANFLDSIFSSAADFIDTIDPISVTPSDVFNNIGIDILQLATLFGVPQALLIIGAAYPIRFILQLIPFVRLGS